MRDKPGVEVTPLARLLVKYEDSTRAEIHDLFSPQRTVTPEAETWGLQGIRGDSGPAW